MSAYDEDFEVVWRDPRPNGKYGKRLDRFVEKLREKPDNWGELPPVMIDGQEDFYTQNVATTLRKAYEGRLVVKTETTDDKRKYRILAKWVGDEDDPERASRRSLRPVGGKDS